MAAPEQPAGLATASAVPPEVWSSPEYVERQIMRIEEALTPVLFGDYSTLVQTDGGDPVWGNLAMHINVVINAVRNAIARAEKSEALAAMRLEIEERNRQLQEALAALERQNQQILEADRLRRQTFANVSHEFRTPLTLCLTPLGSLLGGDAGPLAPRQEYLVEVAQSNAARLLGMINSLLDLARLDAGAVEVRPEPLSLDRELGRIVELFGPTAESRGVELVLRARAGREVVVDATMLEKIASNLISNALKFTPTGGRVTVVGGASAGGLHLLVKDTGIGIPPEALPTIFDRFRQVDGTLARRYEGSGIGLALVKEFVDRLDGRVTVQSVVGRGTTFRLAIPTANLAEARAPTARMLPAVEQRRVELGIARRSFRTPAPAPVPADGPRPRLLIVEDNDEMAALLNGLLESDYEIRRVGNGGEALAVVRAFDPEAILTDLMMPGMDGLSLCRVIKADPDLSAIPVILLTAQGDRDMIVAGWEAGLDEYLVKPFQPHELRVRLRSLLRLRESHRTLAARAAELRETNQLLIESQAQLVQSSKLAAVGQLAAGIAHEINNPLTTILGFAQSLRRRLPADGGHALALDSIEREARRSRDLVRDLLGFSRVSSAAAHVDVDVGGVLRRVASLCAHRARLQAVEFTVGDAAGVPRIRGDAQRLEQVLINLCNNAFDAVTDVRRVTVEAEVEGADVVLRVLDTGCGVPAGMRDKIFEPFVTTKPAGQGTGLGLALCRDIVKAHGGTLGVRDREGGGAVFEVRLPASPAREEVRCQAV